LAGINDFLGVAFFLQLRLLDLEPFADCFLDGIDGDAAFLNVDEMFEDLLSHGQSDRRTGKGRICDQFDQGALEFSHVRLGF